MMMQSDLGLFFLHLCTCKHLDSGLLDLLGLTGVLVLDVAGPRVDSCLGHGVPPRLDRPHDLGSLSSLDLGFVLLSKLHVHVLVVGGEGVGGDELLVVVCEGVSGDKLLSLGGQNSFGISMMMDHVVVANSDLACSFVLSASQFVSPRSVPRQRPSCSPLLSSWWSRS